MADEVRRVEYYYITVADRPGEGYRALSVLRDAGVLLLAYHVFPVGGGQAQIDFVAEEEGKFRRAAESAGWSLVGPKGAFLITGDDRVGAAAEHTKKLADANINVTAATALGAGAGRYGMILWVASTDYDRAATALGA
jgi:hypothetical protein